MVKRKPSWLKIRYSANPQNAKVRQILKSYNLNTVCDGASCPNKSECFTSGVATFMILGDTCTRNCTFCGVPNGKPSTPDSKEPQNVADAAKEMGLDYVVLTSVTRDDLKDDGIKHFDDTVKAIRNTIPNVKVEILTPDFRGITNAAEKIKEINPDVFNHNIEVVPRLYPELRPQANWNNSLKLLNRVSQLGIITKSSMMLGLGETREEIKNALQEVRDAGVNILTLGQYLQPTMDNHIVVEYIKPEDFDSIKKDAEIIGFEYVASGPFVRSSYKAKDAYSAIKGKLVI